jgi:hypothetical protein
MNKGRVGEDRGSKETNGCPLTVLLPLLNTYFIKEQPQALLADMISECSGR